MYFWKLWNDERLGPKFKLQLRCHVSVGSQSQQFPGAHPYRLKRVEMIHFSNTASWLRAAALSGLMAGLGLVSAASAVTLDFNVANGNYTVASNWVDATTHAVS